MRPGTWDWLHSGTWSTANTDEILTDLLRFGLIIGVALAVAWASGRVVRRWLATGDAGSVPLREGALSAFRSFVVLVGLYEAARSLPLAHEAAAFTDGIIYVLAVLFAARFLVRAAALALHRYLLRTAASDEAARERAEREYVPIASTAVTVGAALMAVILIAHHFGHDVSSLVTAFGVGSLAIGLAAQATLGNTIAGFILLVDRPFRPGDRIRLASGESGQIQEIGIRSTRILLPEGNMLVVPNAELANTRVVNLSYPRAQTRGEVRVKVEAGSVEQACVILLELAAAESAIVGADRDGGVAPLVGVTAIDGKAVEIALRFQVPTGDRSRIEEKLRRALVARLGAEHLAAFTDHR